MFTVGGGVLSPLFSVTSAHCCGAGGVRRWEGGGRWVGGQGVHTATSCLMGDNTGLGISEIDSNPNFNFINKIIQNDDSPDNDFLFNNTDFSPYSEINFNCSYINPEQIHNLNNSNLSVISINIQSLPAKFNELSDMLSQFNQANFNPDVLCLQETWQISDPSLFNLPNFQNIILNTRSNARGGGVGIYVKNDLVFSVLTQHSVFLERIIETLFIEITTEDNKKLVIGSIYRPGTKNPGMTFTEQFSQFSDTLSGLLSDLGSIYDNVYIFGDFNLDILKLDENKFISEYIDTLFSHGFLQIITKPTRVSDNSATLIDHILTNSLCEQFDSYILCHHISDHFPIIHFLKLKKKQN